MQGIFWKKRRLIFEALIWVVVWAVFVGRGVVFLDPDFGWHLREGNLILSRGVIRADSLSYTMGGFPEVGTEWLAEIVMAKIYGMVGILGLAAVFSTVALGAVAMSMRGLYKGIKMRVGIFLLTAALVFSFLGVRMQVVTWIFWAGVVRVLLDREKWKRWRYGLPLVFGVWANLHGGYMAGLGAVGIAVGLNMLRRMKIDFIDVGVVGLSALATLINPYGPGNWIEVWRQVHLSGIARWNIMEWLPSIFFFNVPLMVFVSLVFSLVWRYRKKVEWPEMILLAIFSYLGIASVRHVPLWLFLSLPIVGVAGQWLREDTARIRGAVRKLGRLEGYFLAGAVFIFLLQVWPVGGGAGFYPAGAVRYLRANMPRGEIMSDYGWGGYLDWQLPEKRVFVDGRMDVWEWPRHPKDRSENIFKEYLKLTSGEGRVKDEFERYGVDTVLWEAPGPKRRGLEFWEWFGRLLGKGSQKTFIERVEDLGWKKVYEDKVAVIYRKPVEGML